MKVVFSRHANKRIYEKRQNGISRSDVINAVSNFMPNSRIVVDMEFSMKARSGKNFKVVVADKKDCRLIVTIVGC
jgi:hypothetical protein